MAVQITSADRVEDLLREAAVFVDVRSVPEYRAGHVPGAFNVPWMHAHGDRLQPNPEFIAVMRRAFRSEQLLIVGCHSGSRAHKAAAALERAGFRNVVEFSVGFEGRRDPFGRLQPGWRRQGKAVAHEALAGRDYESLLAVGPDRDNG